ncbi:MAG: nitroreductase family protein [Eubacteriaceae bacterium]|nr:nitroreductase family protein [Eubacteriaceae bacterium]
MNTYDAIKKRHSARSYTDRQIEKNDLEKILLAGGMAAVGMGAYDSMKFTVIQNKDLLTEIDNVAGAGKNHPLYGAPTLILLSAKELRLPNIEYSNAGCVIQNMMIMAADLEIDNIYLWGAAMAVKNNPELKAKLNIPEDYHPIASIALGYSDKDRDKVKEEVMKITAEYFL